MLYGNLVNDVLIIATGPDTGIRIVETDPPEAPDGYKVVSRMQKDTRYNVIRQNWETVPIEGTPQEAALALSKLQYMSIADESVAYKFRALADEWAIGHNYYGPDDPSGMLQSRVRYQGDLYKCLNTHVSQSGWEPGVAPSLWTKILPGQEGNEPEEGEFAEWDPSVSSTNGYSKGTKLIHNGHLYESMVDNNTWEPGGEGVYDNIWKDLGEYPA